MTDLYLATLDTALIEVHFARETAMFERFSVTTPGWQGVWLMTKYDGGYARVDECMIRTEAIVWTRTMSKMVWFEIDEANLIPQRKADKAHALKVTNHRGHEEMYEHGDTDNVDKCGVTSLIVPDFGTIYRLEA